MQIPKYFILNDYKAYTTNINPEKTRFEDGTRGSIRSILAEPKSRFTATINLKGLGPITLFGNSFTPHKYVPSMQKKNYPVYKSNLQKCVRRGLVDNAVRTAYAMMSCDLPNFLRRLPIVMLEDVLPHSSIITIVWFMMASTKGYLLSDEQVAYILGVVCMICEIDQYQVFNSSCSPDQGSGAEINLDKLCANHKDLLWSLQFRKAYGGMKCDSNMIDYLTEQWYTRFLKKSPLINYLSSWNVIPINLDRVVNYCDKDDIILEAIDYHCYSWIPKKLDGEHTQEEIRGAIWFYRSRINIRKPCEGSVPVYTPYDLKDVYEHIKDSLNGLCKWIHEKII